MQLLLVPLFGPLHLRWPALNAVTMRDLLAEFDPQQVFTTVLAEGETDDASWQDTFELVLPLSIAPWLKRRQLPLAGVREPVKDPEASADFRRFVDEMPALRERLTAWLACGRQLEQLLGQALTPERLNTEVLPLLREQHAALIEAAGDGPATGWVAERAAVMARRIVEEADAERVAVLAAAEEVPALEEAFRAAGSEPLPLPAGVAQSEEARLRGLLDHALLSAGDRENPELEETLARLDLPEAEYLRAGQLLGRGALGEALAVLERAANMDFSGPYYLPGFLLARLGQLRDAAGDREGARKAYRAVLALSFVPREAREAAELHLQEPFAPAGAPGVAESP